MSYPQKRNMKGVSVDADGHFRVKRGAIHGTDNQHTAKKYRRLRWLARYRKSNGRSVPISRFKPATTSKKQATHIID